MIFFQRPSLFQTCRRQLDIRLLPLVLSLQTAACAKAEPWIRAG